MTRAKGIIRVRETEGTLGDACKIARNVRESCCGKGDYNSSNDVKGSEWRRVPGRVVAIKGRQGASFSAKKLR